MRKSISTAFFSMVSTLMVLGIVLMGCSEWVLFKNYFAKDRYETLDQVVNVAKRTAEYLVNSETMPQGAELDALNTKLEIIGESAEAYLFFTDRQGNVLIASDPDKLTTTTVPLDICQRANAVADPDARHYHAFGDLGGAIAPGGQPLLRGHAVVWFGCEYQRPCQPFPLAQRFGALFRGSDCGIDAYEAVRIPHQSHVGRWNGGRKRHYFTVAYGGQFTAYWRWH